MKHTPAPWKFERGIATRKGVDNTRGNLYGPKGSGFRNGRIHIAVVQQIRDAALLEAAPILLEALKEIVFHWEQNATYRVDIAEEAIRKVIK